VGEHENRRDNAENYTTEVNVINRGYIIGKHKKLIAESVSRQWEATI